jgi:hypothetical protein
MEAISEVKPSAMCQSLAKNIKCAADCIQLHVRGNEYSSEVLSWISSELRS